MVTYASVDQAREQVARLDSKICNNRRIRVSTNKGRAGIGARFIVPQSIIIVGCQPGSAIDSSFRDFVGSIKTLKSSSYDLNASFRIIRSRVASCAGV